MSQPIPLPSGISRFVYCLVLGLLVVGTVNCHRVPRAIRLIVTDHNTLFTIEIGGRMREGSLHVPPAYDGTRPYSLLFALHGANGSGEKFRAMGFDRLADEYDFIVVYPDGIGRRWDSGEDNEFFTRMIEEFKNQYQIDPRRIYVTGHSAGAMESYELASANPGLFTAIAPVSGTVMAETPGENLSPTSVLHIHGLRDEEIPFTGVREWSLLSVPDSVDFWRRVNGGKGIPIPDNLPIPAGVNSGASEVFYDAHGIKGTVWHGLKADTALLVYASGGHSWPPLATELVMDFLYNHPARANRLAIDTGKLPLLTTMGTIINLRPIIEHTVGITAVSFFSNRQLIGTADKAPYGLDWKVGTTGVHRLSAELRMKDGTIIHSMLNPFLLASAAVTDENRQSINGASGGKTATLIPVVSVKSSSDEEGNTIAPFAVDGDFYSRWSSEWTDAETLTLDLGTEHRINGVTILWEQAFAKEYALELSDDGIAWQEVFRQNDGRGEIEFLPIDEQSARFIRFKGITRGTDWGYSFWEIFVHGA